MKIASWNIEGRLSNLATDQRGTPEKIVAAIRQLDADVIVLPEAFGTAPRVTDKIEHDLAELGYKSKSVAYEDSERRGWAAVPNPHLRVMSRLAIVHSEVIRPGGLRSMLSLMVHDPESDRDVRVIGVHLDDRSEERRLRQVGPLIEYINSSAEGTGNERTSAETIPTIMMGDFNAMPPNTPRSKFVHSAGVRLLSHVVPHQHLSHTMSRLNDMATGTTIQTILEKTNLQNIDPTFQPTTTPKMRNMEWMPSLRFAKIDWMFVSPDISYRNFAVSKDLGSDHRALSAEITIKPL